MTRPVLLWGAIAVIASTFFPAAATAQETTRAAEIEAAQGEKARQLTPYELSKAERIAADIQDRLLGTPEGIYPWLDSVYSGGGLTGGAGYRRFIGDRTFVDARGLLSAKGYKLGELAMDGIGDNGTPFDFRASAGWRDATQVSYYGVGNDTDTDSKTNFRMQQAYAGIGMRARAFRFLFGDVQERFESFTLLEGKDEDLPSIESMHTPASAPALGASPQYWRTTVAGGLDTRPSAGYARSGGLYALTYDAFADQNAGAYSFEIVQGEVIQHVPILRENWVLSFHGVAKTTVDDDDVVPYFLMPSLGNGSTLRAYSSWRFRDRHSLLVSGEFRWIPSRLLLDVALFYDAGKVASHRRDLNFSEMHTDWGLGFRFHSPIMTPLRIEIARGHDGFNLVFSGAAAF
jgi:hypothetical protein